MAADAIKHAGEEGYECVLIDTAGRMQVSTSRGARETCAEAHDMFARPSRRW